MPDELKGQGAATSEIDELRARVAALETPKIPKQTTTRMVPLWPGSGVMVPYHGEDLGQRLCRNEFADVDRAEFEADEAVRDIGREVVADDSLRRPLPEPSILPHQHSQIDTRTGQPAQGMPADVRTHQMVDRIAAGYDRLDRAEALERERKARKTLGDG